VYRRRLAGLALASASHRSGLRASLTRHLGLRCPLHHRTRCARCRSRGCARSPAVRIGGPRPLAASGCG